MSDEVKILLLILSILVGNGSAWVWGFSCGYKAAQKDRKNED